MAYEPAPASTGMDEMDFADGTGDATGEAEGFQTVPEDEFATVEGDSPEAMPNGSTGQPSRPKVIRRVVCPDCRNLVEVLGEPNEQGRVHVQCQSCGRQAFIPHKAVKANA